MGKRIIDQKITYSLMEWGIFKNLRRKAIEIIDHLKALKADIVVHGSLARGDIHEKSNVELIILQKIDSEKLIPQLKKYGLGILSRNIIMRSEHSLPTYQLELGYIFPITITVPLIEPNPYDLELYKFGGYVNMKDLEKEIRVAGVDKNFNLIEPTAKGHNIRKLSNVSSEDMETLGIPESVVDDILKESDAHEGTKYFVKQKVVQDQNIENEFRKLLEKNKKLLNYLELSGYKIN